MELCPQTELRVENAYFHEGAPKHGMNNFLGTEIARLRTRNAVAEWRATQDTVNANTSARIGRTATNPLASPQR